MTVPRQNNSPGQQSFEIYAESETRFFTGNQKMLIAFHRESGTVNRIVVTEDGVNGFLLNARRIRNLRFVKMGD